MKCLSFDLPPVEPIASGNFRKLGLQDRIKAVAGDFFVDDLPQADLITMCNVLHDWSEEDKIKLLQKTYQSLPDKGTLVVVENVIDDDRRNNAFGLLMSLNMLIETDQGFDYSLSDFKVWAQEAGFSDIRLMPLTGPASAIIATK